MSQDYYYISTGDKAGFYTLRIRFREQTWEIDSQDRYHAAGYVTHDHYVQNLSTDYQKALAKAKEMAGNLPVQSEEFALKDITRRKAEEIEAALKAQAFKDEEYLHGFRDAGIMTFGKHKGKYISKIPLDYRVWFVTSLGKDAKAIDKVIADIMDSDGSVTKEIENTKAKEAENEIRKAASEYVGEVGTRQEFKLKLMFSTGFEGHYGWINLDIFTDPNGNTFKYMGSASLEVEKGQEVVITATIKKHDEYQGEKQTVINRPKLQEVETI